MTKFKSQDRVRIIGNTYFAPSSLIGTIAKVVATSGHNISVLSNTSDAWWIFDEKDLELVPSESNINIDRELERVFEANRWGA